MKDIKPIHPFPARMAPQLVWGRLQNGPPNVTVLDPMCGSGTTPITAQYLGHTALGFDSDPLAVKLAKAWCARVEEFEFLSTAVDVLERARDEEFRYKYSQGPPNTVDDETRSFAKFWFDSVSRRQLASLSVQIAQVSDEDLRALLWCAFSRMIVTKEKGVSLAMDVSHSRPHRVYERAPVLPFDFWAKSISAIAISKFGSKYLRSIIPEARIQQGDARHLPLDAETVDVVITSPPYLNAIDYLRGHRLSLIWMGYSIPELRRLRTESIGAEAGSDVDETLSCDRRRDAFLRMTEDSFFDRHESRMIARYVSDLDAAIGEVARVLRPEGRAIYVLGDCNLRGRFLQNSALVKFLMRAHDLKWISTRRREISRSRRYLPPPSSLKAGSQLQGRIGDEVVLSFRKP